MNELILIFIFVCLLIGIILTKKKYKAVILSFIASAFITFCVTLELTERNFTELGDMYVEHISELHDLLDKYQKYAYYNISTYNDDGEIMTTFSFRKYDEETGKFIPFHSIVFSEKELKEFKDSLIYLRGNNMNKEINPSPTTSFIIASKDFDWIINNIN